MRHSLCLSATACQTFLFILFTIPVNLIRCGMSVPEVFACPFNADTLLVPSTDE